MQHQQLNELFTRSSGFYSGLSINGKAKVINRVLQFMANKKFIGQDMKVTFEMKAIISLAAVELTYGFDHFLIPHLHTIHVSKDIFYSRLVDSHVKGLTFETGIMYLSWKSVEEGVANRTDGLHVALHEMAHALKIDTVKGSPAKERFPFYLNTWMAFARNMMRSPNHSGFLRAYARENAHEFLAVCLENFIERPEAFYREEPQLFAHTCYLLNQFPVEPKERLLSPEAVRQLSKHTGVRFPQPKHKDYSYHSWHWSLTMLLVSMFVSPVFIGALCWDTVLPMGVFWSWVFCSAIAGIVFYRPVVRYKALDLQMFLAFTFMGAGPAFFSAALVVDRAVTIQNWTETHHIAEVNHLFDRSGTIVTLDHDALHEFEEARTFTSHYYPYLKQDDNAALIVEFERGIFGGKRIRRHDLRFSRTFE